jgi:RNA recognition motif-containing protein
MFLARRVSSLTFTRSYSSKTLYIGNLVWGSEESGVRDLVQSQALNDIQAEIELVRMPRDPLGRTRGFAFAKINFEEDGDLDKAVKQLDGFEFQGRDLRVREANDTPPPQQRVFREGEGRRNWKE